MPTPSRLFQAIGMDAARLLLPVVIVLAAAGILSSVLQNSPRLVLDRIQPGALAPFPVEGLEAHLRRARAARVPQGDYSSWAR